MEFGVKTETIGEKCGIIGVYTEDSAVRLAHLGLKALQHRGQEAAGISVGIDGSIETVKDVGLVAEVFEGGKKLLHVTDGNISSGHVRYGTVEQEDPKTAVQPVEIFCNNPFSFSHNGEINNPTELAGLFGVDESEFGSDSGVLAMAIGNEWDRTGDLRSSLSTVLEKTKGAFSFILMTENFVLGVRDRRGTRPLVIGEMPNGHIIASEVAALKIAGAKYVSEVPAGGVVQISSAGKEEWQWTEDTNTKVCSFEFVYFSRPSNLIGGEQVKDVRERMGHLLAARHPVNADVVIDVPDSGRQTAIGYSHASNIPYDQGIERNGYQGRAFLKPTQEERESAVRTKLQVLESVVEDRKLVVIDDSIVRGTTTREVVRMIREAGAKEIHFRISSAPYKWPCFWGMDTGRKDELLANTMSIEEMREHLELDSLGFLTPEDIRKASGRMAGKLCMACMTGDYPEPVD